MLYRMISNIVFEDGARFSQGAVVELPGRSTKTINLLLKRGAISEVQSPPLRVLPGWTERAAMLEEAGIETITDLLVADLNEVSRKLNVPVDALERAADSARRWIGV